MKKGQKVSKSTEILEEEIGKLKNQVADLEDKWKRALADYQNLEKRLAKEKEEVIRFGKQSLLLKFLNVLDNLKRAHDYAQDPGLELIVKQFWSILESEGVAEIEAESKKFDSYLMECINTSYRPDLADEMVAEVVKKGYMYSDDQHAGQVIRPVQVVVNKRKNGM